MKHEVEYIDWLLDVWAYWEIQLSTGNVGWRPYSSSMIPLNLSDFRTKQFGSRTPPFNEIADRMNYIINQEMAVSYPSYVNILKALYLSSKKKRLKDIAQEQKISVAGLKIKLRDAKLWLDGRVRGDQLLQSY